MARRIVEERTVHELCDLLASKGQAPTTTVIHRELGQGSYTTIQKYIKSWAEIQAATHSPVRPEADLPDEVQEAVNSFVSSLWNQAQSLEEQKLACEREELRTRQSAIEDEFNEVLASTDSAIEKADALADELAAIRSKLETEQELRRQTEKELALQTAALIRAEFEHKSRVLEFESKIEMLTENYENKMRAMTEKYEVKVEQAAILTSEVAQLAKEVKIIGASLSEKKSDLDSIRLKQADAERLLQAETVNNSHLNQRLVHLQRDYELSQEILSEANAEARSVSQQNASLTGKLQERETQIERLEKALDTSRNLVSEMSAKILSLQAAADTNKVANNAENPIKT